jgi:hypothetical protein
VVVDVAVVAGADQRLSRERDGGGLPPGLARRPGAVPAVR